jgi:hypothetical protein
MQAGSIPATQHNTGRVEAARRLENQGHSAARLAVQVQPSSWLQNGCQTAVPVLRLGIHPEMERPAILNRSMPSTAGVTMSILAFQGHPSSACQRYVNLSIDAIYMFGNTYARWGAVLPGKFVRVLTIKGKCSCLRAKTAHIPGHLRPRRHWAFHIGPLGSRASLRFSARRQFAAGDRCYPCRRAACDVYLLVSLLHQKKIGRQVRWLPFAPGV